MKKIFIVLIVSSFGLSACGKFTSPPEGCKGHGGVQQIGHDATNDQVPFVCKDGTIGKMRF